MSASGAPPATAVTITLAFRLASAIDARRFFFFGAASSAAAAAAASGSSISTVQILTSVRAEEAAAQAAHRAAAAKDPPVPTHVVPARAPILLARLERLRGRRDHRPCGRVVIGQHRDPLAGGVVVLRARLLQHERAQAGAVTT